MNPFELTVLAMRKLQKEVVKLNASSDSSSDKLMELSIATERIENDVDAYLKNIQTHPLYRNPNQLRIDDDL